MKNFMKSKLGLSTVVSTLIILVVAVLLASVVTFYAINVTTTRVQEESLQVYKQHIWNDGSSFSEGTFLVVNTGGRDVVIDKIAVRGQECDMTTIYYYKTNATFSTDLTYLTPDGQGTLVGQNAPVSGQTWALIRGAVDTTLILRSGYSMIVYITNPDHVSTNDIGVTIGFTLFTANAQYYKECNVGAAT
jgi:hypothetical protein